MAKPKIRFKGYQDDWEQRKLSEIAIRVTEKNKNNEFTEPFTNSAELGIISQKEYFEREIVNDENLDGYYIVRKDDFVYNPRISGTAPVGPINRNRLERNGVMSPLYTVFRVHDIAELYLEYYFKTTNWHRFMKLNGDSGARFDRFTISSTQFMEMPIPYPKVEEQKKIGAYFSHLDHLITLHQRKCDEAKKLKKFMLQKMFPQNGSLVPEIRFDGFTDDWEQRKLNEITDVRDGTHDSPKYVHEGHPFITSKNVSNGFINYDDVQYVTDEDYEEINKRAKVDVHDILMGMIGTIGNLALIRKEPDFAIKNVALIKYTGDIDYQYLYQTLQADCVTSQLSTEMDGGTQKFVSLKKIRELDIPFPEKFEQRKIGDYFSTVDHLITLHQQKCDDLKNLKKYMLQNMFV